ncbi:MAG: GIY-YIG nuclease family protein [Candidatus Liptonbacteria bacterium]|nr:GIY-YIG nuclease family protein [Candidatus Liptonbacteria bacterium]
MNRAIEKTIRTAPRSAGVYIFMRRRTPIYVGKARDLRQRLSSYLRADSRKTACLAADADALALIPMDSEVEALIRESTYIQTHRPKYNVVFKDDKSYAYVRITKDAFPRLFVAHKSRIDPRETAIGPFTDSGALRTTMRIIRRSFPYCTCVRPHKRACVNAQIGACPGFCCQETRAASPEERASYRKTIGVIRAILRGKTHRMQTLLKKEMDAAVRAEDYRAAAAIRDRYYALEKIFAHRFYLGDPAENSGTRPPERTGSDARIPGRTTAWDGMLANITTAECYDNSHLAGKEAVGAATAWERSADGAWEPVRERWRTFRIRWTPTQDDPRMIQEVLVRRLAHREWPYPDVIIIDGGITQFLAAKRAIGERPVRLISFAKPRALVHGLADKPAPSFSAGPVPISDLPEQFQQLILRAINGTHRFAIGFHRRTRARAFLPR